MQLIWLTPINPILVKESQKYLNYNPSYNLANFLLKFINFCYHDNKGRSGRRLNDTAKWADPQNYRLEQVSGTGSGPILNTSRIRAYTANLLLKNSQNFRYHGNRGWSDTNFSYGAVNEYPKC